MEKSKPLVIVLSRNYSTGLGIIRSLGAAGYTIDLIASVKQAGSSIITSCSKYVRNSVEILSPVIQGDNGDGILKEILKYSNEKDQIVLFPTDDFTTSIIAKNYNTLSKSFLMPKHCGNLSLIYTMDKSFQSKIATSAGLYTIPECVIDLNKMEIPDSIDYPCFVKPAQSVNGRKNEMQICNSKDELVHHLTEMKSFFANRKVLVQKHLKIDREFDLSGLCLNQEIIIPAVIEKSKISKYELGVTMAGTILDTSVLGETKDKIISLLKSLKYFGMFDMELFECDGKIYFNEINLRSGGPNYSYYLNGVNLPDIFVKELVGLGHNKAEEKVPSFGKTFVYEKVAWEDYIHSFITKKELKECINNADYTLLADKNDPAPGNRFFRRIRLSAIKHKILIALRKE